MRPLGAAPDRPVDIEFRHLRYFAAVAEELHFGRAAARLNISQPGLSQAIARLERQLGVRLFTRTRSKIELTEAGTELLHRGRRLLADRDGAVTRVRMAGRGETGLIRIGVAHLAEPTVAPALAAFQAEHASIAVDRSAMVSERLLEQLAEGRLHVAVIHQVPGLAALDGVRTEPLRRGRLAVLAGPESTLAGRPVVTLSELGKETFPGEPAFPRPGRLRRPQAHVPRVRRVRRQRSGIRRRVDRGLGHRLAADPRWRHRGDGRNHRPRGMCRRDRRRACSAATPIRAGPGLAGRRASGRKHSRRAHTETTASNDTRHQRTRPA